MLAQDIARNDAAMFCDFHGDIDRAVDVAVEIHLVMDNGSSHTAKACLDARPRFVAHYTPPHASWARQRAHTVWPGGKRGRLRDRQQERARGKAPADPSQRPKVLAIEDLLHL
ncbi:MAG: hypothetical protein ACYDEY_04105 [Acidimicrobiales bacterium]